MAQMPLLPGIRTAAGMLNVTRKTRATKKRRKKTAAKKRTTRKAAAPRRKVRAKKGPLKKGSPAAKRRMAQLRRIKARKR